MKLKSDSDNRKFEIFATIRITLIVLILSGCTGLTYPNPIPCGDTDQLINAIVIANSNSDPNTIELEAGCVYELTETYDHGGLVGSTGLPQITSEITISGNGAAIVRSTAVGTPKFRLILVGDSGYLFLQDLTLQNGYADDPLNPDMERNSGGAIRNANYLTLENVTIQNNSANGAAGGIFNEEYMAMIFSSISGSEHEMNGVPLNGGAAFHNYEGASATIVQSTIYGNGQPNPTEWAPLTNYVVANEFLSSMIIENSTISGNIGTALGNLGDLDLIFSTIVDNDTGLHDTSQRSSSVDVVGSLFQNTRDCTLRVDHVTTNLNNMDSDGTCHFSYTVPASGQGLLPLANNGGATLTHALDPTSPAIDAALDGASGGCPVFEDQRDVPRPQNGICDIGAYEHDGIIPPVGGEIFIPPTETPVVPPVDDPGDEPSGEDDDPPTPVPSRCDLFDSENATLTMHDIPYGSTTLELFVQYPHPLPGLEEEIPGNTRPWEYSATLGNAVADKCAYREYSGRIYCSFTLTKNYFGYTFPLDVRVNFCDESIFFHKAVTVFEPIPPATETPTPIACNLNLNKSDCTAAGGTYHDQNQVCSCP